MYNRGVWSKGYTEMGFWCWLLSNYGLKPLQPLVNIQKNKGKSWETSPFLMGNLWVIYGKSWKNHYFLNGYINCKLLWLQVRKLLVITREIAMASIPEGKWCKNHRNETGCDFGTSSCLWCLRCSFFPLGFERMVQRMIHMLSITHRIHVCYIW